MGNKNTTFLSINGRRYNPENGQLLDSTPAAPIITDIVRVKKQVATVVSAPKPIQIQAPTTPTALRKQVMDIRSIGHIKAHRTQQSKTLMRTVVKKPAPGLKRSLKAVTRTDILVKKPSAAAIQPKLSVLKIDEKRLANAQHIAKSSLVQRFSARTSDEQANTPAAIPFQTMDIAPVNFLEQHQPAVKQKSMDVFEKALARANAHEAQPLSGRTKHLKKLGQYSNHAKKTGRQPVRHRTASLVAASCAVLILTGFIAYQNKSTLLLHYASAQAGFHANLPAYAPGGFAVGALKYHVGQISIAYNNSNSNQSYTLTQKSSNWDSQTLLDNVVATSNQKYQTLQTKGQTVFIYDNNNATWTSNGIVYQLDSNGSLSSSQVLDVASSL